MSTEPESFLTRWSRRKRATERAAEGAKEQRTEKVAPVVPAPSPAKDADEAGAQPGAVSAPAHPAGTPEVPLPPIESLDGLRSDYRAFFPQPVAEDVRHAALKKLFADPHFNKMDMLDVYVDDYTQFEPLPAAMQLRLASGRDFLLDSERAPLETAEAESGAASDTTEPLVAAADEDRVVAARPGAGGEPDNSDDARVESRPALTSAPTSADSANDSQESVDIASSSVLSTKTTARDPSSS